MVSLEKALNGGVLVLQAVNAFATHILWSRDSANAMVRSECGNGQVRSGHGHVYHQLIQALSGVSLMGFFNVVTKWLSEIIEYSCQTEKVSNIANISSPCCTQRSPPPWLVVQLMMDCLTKKDFTPVGEIKGMELNSMFSRGKLPFTVQRVVHVLLMNRPKTGAGQLKGSEKSSKISENRMHAGYYLVASQRVLGGGGFLYQKDRSRRQGLI